MTDERGDQGDRRPWFCDACGYALLDEANWETHTAWHRRERVRAEYAAADAEIVRAAGGGR